MSNFFKLTEPFSPNFATSHLIINYSTEGLLSIHLLHVQKCMLMRLLRYLGCHSNDNVFLTYSVLFLLCCWLHINWQRKKYHQCGGCDEHNIMRWWLQSSIINSSLPTAWYNLFGPHKMWYCDNQRKNDWTTKYI